jgi:hypothetical protein
VQLVQLRYLHLEKPPAEIDHRRVDRIVTSGFAPKEFHDEPSSSDTGGSSLASGGGPVDDSAADRPPHGTSRAAAARGYASVAFFSAEMVQTILQFRAQHVATGSGLFKSVEQVATVVSCVAVQLCCVIVQ